MTFFERLALRKKLVKTTQLIAEINPEIYNVNSSQIIFAIPHGINPNTLHDKSYVFKQVFGENVELEGDLKRFILTIPNKPMPSNIAYKLDDWQSILNRYSVPIICGIDALGKRIAFDLSEHPHVLITGETGSGKSSLLRVIITSLITTQNSGKVRLVLGDLKRSEFGLFRRLPHVESVSTDADTIERELVNIKAEMKRRGDMLDAEEVTHIKAIKEPLPYIIVAIDEVALLRKEKRIMDIIEDISSVGRSLGVLLILSMQRADSGILEGRLKNNLTVRLSGRQSNRINANVAGLPGAEMIKQSERGRMLIDIEGIKRIQTPWLDEGKTKRLISPFKVKKKPIPVEKPTNNTDDAVIFGLLGGNINDET